jgi:peptidoglycan/LPS O-acetylase OafA/YrhL
MWMVALAVPLFVLGNVSQVFWPWSHLGALVLMMASWQWCSARIMQYAAARRPLAWLGGLALPLFLVNGFLRQPFLGWAEEAASETRILSYAFLFLVVSIAVAWSLQQTEQRLRVVLQQLSRRPGVAVVS